MKYYIIAGEASGDLHGSNLIKALKKHDREAEFRAWGGDKMEAAGATLVKHYRDHAIMGIVAILKNLGTIRKNFALCEADIAAYKPDVMIFIDYSAFNLRVAAKTHKMGLRNFYYIAPQVWVWRSGRVKKIKKYIEQTFVILPFEPDFYQRYNYRVNYFGHPILDALPQKQLVDGSTFRQQHQIDGRPIVALLPGSRKQELASMLPVMLKMSQKFPDYQFVVAATSAVDPQLYQELMAGCSVPMVHDQTYELLQNSHAALVTSGTATLETALLQVPQVVCYTTSYIAYKMVKSLIKVRFISLVNLIMDREVVKELIQKDFNEEQLAQETEKILRNGPVRVQILADYATLKAKLGGGGTSEKAAAQMVALLQQPATA